jgi:hypothetical protein
MVAVNPVETNSQSSRRRPAVRVHFSATASLHVRAIAPSFAAIYAKGVLRGHQARVNARLGRRQCRFYLEGRSSGRTFAVASAVKASVSIGSRILPPNAQPYDPSSWANSGITIRGNKAATKHPLPIRLISSDCQAGQGRRSSPGRPFSQALPGRPATSPKSS